MKRFLDFLCDIRLGFYLLLFISLLMAIGSYYSSIYPEIIRSLNDIFIQEWVKRLKIIDVFKIWWLFLLLILLFIFAINTIFCTIKRIYVILQNKKLFNLKEIILKLIPLIIHFCFIVSLVGHLMSLTIGINQKINLKKESSKIELQNYKIKVNKYWCEFYNTSNYKLLRQCYVCVEQNGLLHEQKLYFLHPLSINGIKIFLDKEKTKDHRIKSPNLVLRIKKDSGALVTLIGDALMSGFIFIYIFIVYVLRRNNNYRNNKI